MKQLIIIIFCGSGYFCKAQQNKSPLIFKQDTFDFKTVYKLANKPKLIIGDSKVTNLPLDNMPCLVTNKNTNAPIPNKFKIDAFIASSEMPNALPFSKRHSCWSYNN